MAFMVREIESPDPVTRVAAADTKLRYAGDDDIGETMVLNMGPSHPAQDRQTRQPMNKPGPAGNSELRSGLRSDRSV